MTGARHGIAPTCTRPTHGSYCFHSLTSGHAFPQDTGTDTRTRPADGRPGHHDPAQDRLGPHTARLGSHTARPGPALTRARPSHPARARPPHRLRARTASLSTACARLHIRTSLPHRPAPRSRPVETRLGPHPLHASTLPVHSFAAIIGHELPLAAVETGRDCLV